MFLLSYGFDKQFSPRKKKKTSIIRPSFTSYSLSFLVIQHWLVFHQLPTPFLLVFNLIQEFSEYKEYFNKLFWTSGNVFYRNCRLLMSSSLCEGFYVDYSKQWLVEVVPQGTRSCNAKDMRDVSGHAYLVTIIQRMNLFTPQQFLEVFR